MYKDEDKVCELIQLSSAILTAENVNEFLIATLLVICLFVHLVSYLDFLLL